MNCMERIQPIQCWSSVGVTHASVHMHCRILRHSVQSCKFEPNRLIQDAHLWPIIAGYCQRDCSTRESDCGFHEHIPPSSSRSPMVLYHSNVITSFPSPHCCIRLIDIAHPRLVNSSPSQKSVRHFNQDTESFWIVLNSSK